MQVFVVYRLGEYDCSPPWAVFSSLESAKNFWYATTDGEDEIEMGIDEFTLNEIGGFAVGTEA
jgi:hypothetical protein